MNNGREGCINPCGSGCKLLAAKLEYVRIREASIPSLSPPIFNIDDQLEEVFESENRGQESTNIYDKNCQGKSGRSKAYTFSSHQKTSRRGQESLERISGNSHRDVLTA